MQGLEDRKDPKDPKQTGAAQRDDHRHDGIADAAQAADQRIHDAAQEVSERDDVQPLQPIGNDLRIIGIDAKQWCAEQHRAPAQYDANDSDHAQTHKQDPIHSLIIACTHVLSGKAQRSLIHRVHGSIDKAFDVAGGGIACHHQ